MSRKMKKGYFVQGEFVVEGSERDVQLKHELKGTQASSRTELKAQSEALQKLGQDLLTLRADVLQALALPEQLLDALQQARRITDFEGKRRQLQFVGKLMRKLESASIERIRSALSEHGQESAADIGLLHQTEQWRERLIADDAALAAWIEHAAHSDIQQLRALIRQARKSRVTDKPGAASRHGRAYRELFQLLRNALTDRPDNAWHTDPTNYKPREEAS